MKVAFVLILAILVISIGSSVVAAPPNSASPLRLPRQAATTTTTQYKLGYAAVQLLS